MSLDELKKIHQAKFSGSCNTESVSLNQKPLFFVELFQLLDFSSPFLSRFWTGASRLSTLQNLPAQLESMQVGPVETDQRPSISDENFEYLSWESKRLALLGRIIRGVEHFEVYIL